MGLIDRTDLLSGCGGPQGAEQQARARDAVSLSAIATFVTAPLVERARVFFPSRAATGSAPLIYHTEELNVDTSKYFHTQGSPEGRVLSPCLKWKGPIHHGLFVTENTESVCVFERAKHTCVFSSINYSNMCICMCVICICQTQTGHKGGGGKE